jgi:hypothetical protein
MGSYFQRPAEVERSAALLAEARLSGLSDYLGLLRRCINQRLGLYVTF